MKTLRSDPQEIARAIGLLFQQGEVVELRIPRTEREGTVSGYFADHAALARQLAGRNGDTALYVTLNPVTPSLLARAGNRIKARARTTTSDRDIDARHWLLVDCDPVRPTEISSTEGEHEAAIERAREIRFMLSEDGWPAPAVADSGNGAHLLYRLALPNDDASAKLVEAVLKALATRFDDATVKVDQTVFNASRITKAYGTVVRKGDDLPERPHRLSRILDAPSKLEPVSRKLLEEMAGSASPRPAPPPNTDGRPGRFELEGFLARHLQARAPVAYEGGRKWVLETCPFDPEHKAPDSAVFERADGSIGFKCLHNSCAGKRWIDVRALFDGPRPNRPAGRPRPPKAEPVKREDTSPRPAAEAVTASDRAEAGAKLLADIERYIRRYVVLPAAAYLTLALWALATHAVEGFDCFPYIAIVSAAKRCGKTRLAEVLETLVRRPWRGTAPSPAALYRMLEGAPTLLLDETELLNGKNKSEATLILLAVLNAGHRKGATIPRCDGPRQEVKQFPVYGPKLFAAIGRLPDTLLDRSIVVHMKRRSKAQRVERFRQARAAAEAKPIHDSAARFVKTCSATIGEAYQMVLDNDLEYLTDRDADLWTPLFAVCAVIDSKHLPDLKECAEKLSTAKAGDDVDDSWALTLLRDIRAVWPDEQDKLETAILLERLKALEESPWMEQQLTPRKLARMLRPFEVVPRNLQIETRRPKGYHFDEFKDAFDLYLDEKCATSATDQ